MVNMWAVLGAGVLGGIGIGIAIGTKLKDTEYASRIQQLEIERDNAVHDMHEKIEYYQLAREATLDDQERKLDEHISTIGDYDHPTDDEPEEDDYEDEDKDESFVIECEPAYLITEDEYERSKEDCERLTYFQLNDVLLDSHDDVVKDQEAVVGIDAMERLQDTDEDILYVRNESLEIDYEILIKRNQDYYDDYLGV